MPAPNQDNLGEEVIIVERYIFLNLYSDVRVLQTGTDTKLNH